MGNAYLAGAVLICLCLAAMPAGAQEATPGPPHRVGLDLVANGFDAPVALEEAPDGSGRLFAADQSGTVRIIAANRTLLDEPFLDVRSRMVSLNPNGDERGLLGIAFHPDFADNGRFFVYYSAPLRPEGPAGWDHTSRVAEYAVRPGDPDRADPSSERTVLDVDQPQANHNAGQILFGPDGSLYIALGDGGGGNDAGIGHPPEGNGQTTATLPGSILRIDVDGGEPYAVPADNPFAGGGGRGEIYAYGFRNPYRISFDRGGEYGLIAADVGQRSWEEINLVIAGGNYGWNIREGAHCVDPGTCPSTGPRGEPLIDPVLEYPNTARPGGMGAAVIGGYVYRGTRVPALNGTYLFGDWVGTGGGLTLFAAVPPFGDGAQWTMAPLAVAENGTAQPGLYLLGFGQDIAGEMYVLTSDASGPAGGTGKIFAVSPASRTHFLSPVLP
ncbi:MAG: PQQ-dependent sugar dehydrogenase [Methanomicrobiaceae archaeon]|nr:PQQ-dependent sugar dehydrogenase [Methanomicrobiaceae archaeon]